MAKIFISHSSKNNPEAKAFVEWLFANGWDDYFFDIDVQGISPGEQWEAALRAAADRCEAVIFLISDEWLGSTWCIDEFRLTRLLGKRKLFGVIVEPVDRARIPSELSREWQLCDLKEPGETEQVKTEWKGKSYSFDFSCTGLDRLKIGLRKAGLSPESFDFDVSRSPYPGPAALDMDDAARWEAALRAAANRCEAVIFHFGTQSGAVVLRGGD
jgi:TIR domain